MKHLFLYYTDNRNKLIICNIEVYKYIAKRSHKIFTFLSPKSCLFNCSDFNCNDYFFIAENISEQSSLH